MATSVNGVNNTGSSQTDTSGSTASTQLGKEDFLKLLVAQIKNQNPLDPTDGVEFLSQLAQFSQLEQLINIGSQLDTLVADVEAVAAASTASESSNTTAAS